jgi:hypothetical protein
MRLLRFALPLLLAVPFAPSACAQDKPLGAIVVQIDTNVLVPKNINGLGLAVAVAGEVKFSNVYGVAPDGRVTLPATLVVEEPRGGTSAPAVNIRITAFNGSTPRIVRDAVTTIPHERIAAMRLQLSFLSADDGLAGAVPLSNIDRTTNPADQGTTAVSGRIHLSGPTPGEFKPFESVSSKCLPQLTLGDLTAVGDIDGICQSAYVDSATLPDYVTQRESSFLGDEGGTGASATVAPECFDVASCLGQLKVVTPRASDCSFDFVGDPTRLNVGILTKSTLGYPTSLGYVSPLDNDPVHGFSLANGRVTLPKAVCANPKNPNVLGVVVDANHCGSKAPGTPLLGNGIVCANLGVDGGTPTDGGNLGSSDSGSVDAGPAAPVFTLPKAGLVTVAQSPIEKYVFVGTAAGAVSAVNVNGAAVLGDSADFSASVAASPTGGMIVTDGNNVSFITYPPSPNTGYATFDPAAHTFGTAVMQNPQGANVIGAAMNGAVEVFAVQLSSGYVFRNSLPAGPGSIGLITPGIGNGNDMEALYVDQGTLYGSIRNTSSGVYSTGVVNVLAASASFTQLNGAPSVTSHAGSMVLAKSVDASSQTLLLTDIASGKIIGVDFQTHKPITAIAAGIVSTAVEQPFNLVTDAQGNVYYATPSGDIMKLGVYPTLGAPTLLVDSKITNAKAGRTLAYQSPYLYWVSDGVPATAGVWTLKTP